MWTLVCILGPLPLNMDKFETFSSISQICALKQWAVKVSPLPVHLQNPH